MASSNETRPATTLPATRGWEHLGDLDFFGPSLFRRVLGPYREYRPSAGRGEPAGPAFDFAENQAGYVATVELPGCKSEDVDVAVQDAVLTVRGTKRNERSEREERLHWTERSFGSFSRAFGLPGDADATRISASFQDGVLTIEIAKKEESEPRVVRIDS